MPFGMLSLVGPQKHALDGGLDPHVKGQFLGIRTCTTICHELCKTAELMAMLFGLWAQVDSSNCVLDGVSDSP